MEGLFLLSKRATCALHSTSLLSRSSPGISLSDMLSWYSTNRWSPRCKWLMKTSQATEYIARNSGWISFWRWSQVNQSESFEPSLWLPSPFSTKPSIWTPDSPSLPSASAPSFSRRFLFILSMTLSARLNIPPVGAPHARHLGVFAKRLMAHAEQK